MEIELWVNGERKKGSADESSRLIDLLREQFGLTGTKEGCGAGECGACTVLLNGDPVCSCTTPAFQTHGLCVTTIEGLEHDELAEAVRAALIEQDAVQCGFCTPGQILTAYALLKGNPSPTRAEIKRALAGNLCRCTGYVAIVNAVQAVARSGGNG